MESNVKNNLPLLPYSMEETGLDMGAVADLVMKTLYARGVMRGHEIAEVLKLPYGNIIERTVDYLRVEHLVDVRPAAEFDDGAIRFMVSRSGRMRVQELLERNQYVGPAPVTLEAYTKMVEAQSLLGQTMTQTAVRNALSHLVLSDQVIQELGPAANSGKSVFIYGNAGNGKTSIGLSLGKLLSGAIWIPYAIDVQGQTIKVYDPLRHKLVVKKTQEDSPSPVRKGLLSRLRDGPEDSEVDYQSIVSESHDERWVLVRRPLIVAGGELTLKSLDLVFDSTMRYYEASQQMKANGGVFLLDDLGRQQASAREILNRWTVPLEKRIDYLNLVVGFKFQVPFDVLIVFATNLNPLDLVDESYLRRIRYKVHIPDPTWDEFHEIFKREAAKHDIAYSQASVQSLIDKCYLQDQRQPRGVHPRDLLDQLQDIARFRNVAPTMSVELLEQAYAAYFLRKEKTES